MIEIFINNQRLDLGDHAIFQTFQNNAVGSVNDRQTSFTNNIKVPKTPNNIKIFNNIGLVGINNSFDASEFPYGFPTARLLEDGIEILSNGFIKLNNIDEYFNVAIYGAEKTFFEVINQYTLQDVDIMSTTSIVYDEANFTRYLKGTAQNGLIIAWAFFNESMQVHDQQTIPDPWNIDINMLNITPQMYVNYFFDSIFETFGYLVDHNLGDLDDFNNLVINATTGVSSMGLSYGDTVHYNEVAPEINLKTFLVEILFRFAATIKIDEQTKTVYIRQWTEIIGASENFDWSDKFHNVKNIKHSLSGYGQTNNMTYEDDIAATYSNAVAEENELKGTFELQDLHLDIEQDILNSIFKKPKYYKEQDLNISTSGALSYNFLDLIDYTTTGGAAYNSLESYLLYLKQIPSNGSNPLEIRVSGASSIFYVTVSMGAVSGSEYAFILSYLETSFQNYIDEYYQEFIAMLNSFQEIDAYFLLSAMDIYKLDYFKKIYVKQLGGFFYLNKINNYKSGKLTEVELIKIP